MLRDEADVALGVQEIERWCAGGGRVVAVVSAFEGTTDALLASARRFDAAADDPAAAMLLATGELTTASLLGLAVRQGGRGRGRACRVLNPHSAGLRTRGGGADADPASIDVAAFGRAIDECGVVVVPGFVGVDAHGHFALLGRGGSDLTALFAAAELGAARCRLIKDVDGVYDADPNAPGSNARRYRELWWDDALRLDGGIVQHKAVRFARSRGLAFEVGSFGREGVTVVGAGPSVLEGRGVAEGCFAAA